MHRSGFRAFVFSLLLVAWTDGRSDCPLLIAVDVETSDFLTEDDKNLLLEPLIGRCIDTPLTREILARLSNFFIEQGLVTTRPYLLEQDVSDGRLDVKILPGEIEAVIDAASGSSNRSIRGAFLFSDSILNLRQLETALEVIQRPESVDASFEIRPGSRPGASIVAIDSTRSSPFELELGVNAQTDLDAQISLRARLDNPLNFNDILEFRGNSGEVRESFQSNQSRELNYSFGLGAYLLSLDYSQVEFEQRLQAVNESFLSRGKTDVQRIALDKLLFRNRAHRWYLGLALQLRDSRNFLEGQLIDVSSYKTSQLQIELRHDWLARWGQWSNRYGYDQGLDSFGARDDDYYAADGSGREARLQFDRFRLDSRLQFYPQDSQWLPDLHLYLQYSDDLLFDSEWLNLGSPYTVRGYSSALGGGNGAYLQFNLSRQLRSSSQTPDGLLLRKSILFSVGLDYGEIECQLDNPDICGHIYGLGLGLRIEDRNFLGQLSWGHPLREIENDNGDKNRFLLDFRWII